MTPLHGTTPVERVFAYHERTKHHLHRYARSLGSLDWDTQPDPFRTYDGAPIVPLPLFATDLTPLYDDLYCPGRVPPEPLNLATIACLFELSLGLTAWKEHRGSRWALRANPSSGNLHPTEGYLLAPSLPELPAGVYHYVSRDHVLERRCTLNAGRAAGIAALLPPSGLLVGLASIHWREAWKYGERAFRYCQHDAGHAIAAIRYAAAVLGWSALLLEGLGDAQVAALLGLDRDEDAIRIAAADREHPDGLLLVCPSPVDRAAAAAAFCNAIEDAVDTTTGGAWAGQANPLSPGHVAWDIIDDVAEATWKAPSTLPPCALASSDLPPPARCLGTAEPGGGPAASFVIRTRRSALDFDDITSMDRDSFYAMLDLLLPRPQTPPWDAWPWAPRIHLLLFAHRIRGLAPGLYILERDEHVHDRLRAATHPEMLWTPAASCPPHLRLYCLGEGDLRQTAQVVSCHQEIAAAGTFSFAMIADFAEPIRSHGAWFYRRLFWEAGMLGQVLYLEAEACRNPGGRLRATGIGCYFDDVCHEVAGLSGSEWQSLYHFTMGGPVEDTRLSTWPPYSHLPRGRWAAR
jgi:SagB-type dehydrogenase family enzyme